MPIARTVLCSRFRVVGYNTRYSNVTDAKHYRKPFYRVSDAGGSIELSDVKVGAIRKSDLDSKVRNSHSLLRQRLNITFCGDEVSLLLSQSSLGYDNSVCLTDTIIHSLSRKV